MGGSSSGGSQPWQKKTAGTLWKCSSAVIVSAWCCPWMMSGGEPMRHRSSTTGTVARRNSRATSPARVV
jgi:hypothetical protein